MRRERAGGDFESGMVATGFWTGITVGRLVLGFVTPRLGEKFAVLVSTPQSHAAHHSPLIDSFQDIHHPSDGMPADVLACAILPCLGHLCITTRFLPRTTLSSYCSSSHQSFAGLPSCLGYWICRCFWRRRRSCTAFCYWVLSTGKGRRHSSADHSGCPGIFIVAVAVLPKTRQAVKRECLQRGRTARKEVVAIGFRSCRPGEANDQEGTRIRQTHCLLR